MHLQHTFSYSLDHNECKCDESYCDNNTNVYTYHYDIEPVVDHENQSFQEHLDVVNDGFTEDFDDDLDVFLCQNSVNFIDNSQDQVQHSDDRHENDDDQIFIVVKHYIEDMVYYHEQEVLQQHTLKIIVIMCSKQSSLILFTNSNFLVIIVFNYFYF